MKYLPILVILVVNGVSSLICLCNVENCDYPINNNGVSQCNTAGLCGKAVKLKDKNKTETDTLYFCVDIAPSIADFLKLSCKVPRSTVVREGVNGSCCGNADFCNRNLDVTLPEPPHKEEHHFNFAPYFIAFAIIGALLGRVLHAINIVLHCKRRRKTAIDHSEAKRDELTRFLMRHHDHSMAGMHPSIAKDMMFINKSVYDEPDVMIINKDVYNEPAVHQHKSCVVSHDIESGRQLTVLNNNRKLSNSHDRLQFKKAPKSAAPKDTITSNIPSSASFPSFSIHKLNLD